MSTLSEITKQALLPAGLALAVVFGVNSCNGSFVATQEAGHDYLKGQGFTQVEGGEDWNYWNNCGRHNLSRDYLVAAKDSGTSASSEEVETQRVCFHGSKATHTKIEI
jgi:hypothetical protein